jgi:putative membrane protein
MGILEKQVIEMMYNMMYGYYGFGWLWMIVFWAAVIWLIVWLVRRNQCGARNNASDILKERYAKGEITKKEFDQMKRDLS